MFSDISLSGSIGSPVISLENPLEINKSLEPAHTSVLVFAKDLADHWRKLRTAEQQKNSFSLANGCAQCISYLGITELDKNQPLLSDLIKNKNYLDSIVCYCEKLVPEHSLRRAVAGTTEGAKRHILSILEDPNLKEIERKDWLEIHTERIKNIFVRNINLFDNFDWEFFFRKEDVDSNFEVSYQLINKLGDSASENILEKWKKLHVLFSREFNTRLLMQEIEGFNKSNDPEKTNGNVAIKSDLKIIQLPRINENKIYELFWSGNKEETEKEALIIKDTLSDIFKDGFFSAKIAREPNGKVRHLVIELDENFAEDFEFMCSPKCSFSKIPMGDGEQTSLVAQRRKLQKQTYFPQPIEAFPPMNGSIKAWHHMGITYQ